MSRIFHVPRVLGVAALALVACAKPPPRGGSSPGDGTIASLTPVAKGGASFTSPMDATLSPDGRMAYFSALVEEAPAIFKSDGAAEPSMLAQGAPLSAPFGLDISSDGATLFVSDPAAELGP